MNYIVNQLRSSLHFDTIYTNTLGVSKKIVGLEELWQTLDNLFKLPSYLDFIDDDLL